MSQRSSENKACVLSILFQKHRKYIAINLKNHVERYEKIMSFLSRKKQTSKLCWKPMPLQWHQNDLPLLYQFHIIAGISCLHKVQGKHHNQEHRYSQVGLSRITFQTSKKNVKSHYNYTDLHKKVSLAHSFSFSILYTKKEKPKQKHCLPVLFSGQSICQWTLDCPSS